MVKKESKLTVRQWLEEYAKDMGFRFVVKTGEFPYRLIKGKDEYKFKTLSETQHHVMRALQRYIGEHTTIVDDKGNVIEMSIADKKKLSGRK